jgi:hypothetical protein
MSNRALGAETKCDVHLVLEIETRSRAKNWWRKSAENQAGKISHFADFAL